VKIEIGSYEAKSKLPELLRGVKTGNRYTITLRGEAVAELIPSEAERRSDAVAAVEDMLSFMDRHQQASGAAGLDLKALIDEGRA
jgi:prevent-host-death family protein